MLAAQVELRNFAARERIYKKEDPGGQAYVLLYGKVRVTTVDEDHQEVVVDEPGPGEFFGEMSLVEPAPRSASVTSMQATFLFRLPHDQLRDLITEDAHAASVLLVQVVKTLSERLRRANTMLSSVDMLADWLAGSMV